MAVKASDVKYYKVDKTHSRVQVGTGIGLSIVKNILIQHNFTYGVESKLNKDDVRFVSKSMMNEFYKYYKCRDDDAEPYILLPNISTYENTIMAYASKENALVKTVRCGKIAVG